MPRQVAPRFQTITSDQVTPYDDWLNSAVKPGQRLVNVYMITADGIMGGIVENVPLYRRLFLLLCALALGYVAGRACGTPPAHR